MENKTLEKAEYYIAMIGGVPALPFALTIQSHDDMTIGKTLLLVVTLPFALLGLPFLVVGIGMQRAFMAKP